MIDSATFEAMVRNASGDSNRVDFMKQQCGLVKKIDADFVVKMANLVGDGWKVDVVKAFKSYLNVASVPTLMTIRTTETWKLDIVKVFNYSGTPKPTILSIIGCFHDDTWTLDVIKYFKNWFGWSDVLTLMRCMKDDTWKYDVVKLFADKYTGATKADVLAIIAAMKEDTWRFDGLKFFEKWFMAADIVALCGLMKETQFKTKVLNLFRLGGVCNTPGELAELINSFGDDHARFCTLEKKIKDGIIVSKEMINIIESFKEEKYRKKICVMLFNADRGGVFDADCCLSLMSMFTIPQRMTLLTEYRKTHTVHAEKVVALIKQLESKGNAVKFLNEGGFTDTDAQLTEAGYKAAATASVEDEDESESESEPEPELEDDDSDDDDIHGNIISIPNMNLGQKVEYDIKRDVVLLSGHDFMGSITMNGVNIKEEARRQGQKIAKKRKEKKEKAKQKRLEAEKKKNQLKVPHAWKDRKVDDKTPEDDICVVCHEKRRMITLNCGHYHTCGRCTRVVLKGNKQCPVCRAAITTVIRTFA